MGKRIPSVYRGEPFVATLNGYTIYSSKLVDYERNGEIRFGDGSWVSTRGYLELVNLDQSTNIYVLNENMVETWM